MLNLWDKTNFDEVKRAMVWGDVCLVDLVRRDNGRHVAVICAYWEDDQDRYWFTPLAQMIEGNAFELFEKPDPNQMDGYFGPEEGGTRGGKD